MTPLKQTLIRAPWHNHFQNYLGRKLSRAERHVISSLERARKRRTHRAILVLDPPGMNSEALLRDYLAYITKDSAGKKALVIQPQRPKARRKDYLYTTPRYPDNIRGHSVHSALLLNVHDYGSASPYHGVPARWYKIVRAVLPMLSPEGLFIIHSQRPPGIYPSPLDAKILINTPPPKESPPPESPPPEPPDSPPPEPDTPQVIPLTVSQLFNLSETVHRRR